MQIKEKIKLAPYTTFKIGGEAKFLGVVKDIEDLKQGVNFAKQNSLPIFILGGGSNLLISDDGFDGLVLKMENKDLEAGLPNDGEVEVGVGAGMVLDDLAYKMAKRNLWGLENLSWIPGTVGAGAVQNCGAFGVEMKDVIAWVEVFDIESGETCLPAGRLKRLSNEECQFGYRNSIFKKKPNWVIIQVALKLSEGNKANLNYKGLEDLKDIENLKVKDVRKKIIEIRGKNFPLSEGLGSAGCFYKNPVIAKKDFEKLKEKFPEIPFFENGEDIKIAIAWFIDQFGWKGFFDGEVGVYDKHALMLVNKGEGTCEEVKKLAEKIEDDVFYKTGLKLEKEVVFV
ncbi:UDP-N-acetylmuramate dehydrogenase [Patescibacteria group bacterium]|nr:UDP-N-acetylmuramate dehydrogenase [Patescibacteria group bacterium]